MKDQSTTKTCISHHEDLKEFQIIMTANEVSYKYVKQQFKMAVFY